MRYISTRGGMPPKTFSEILLSGLSPDGGLAIPEKYPTIEVDQLKVWRDLSYQSLAFEILSHFIDDIPSNDLRDIVNRTYTSESFGNP